MDLRIASAIILICRLTTIASCSNLAGVDDSILFKIRWRDPLNLLKELPGEENFDAVRMMSADKEPFVCYVPKNLQVQGDDIDVKSYQGPSPLELLEPLFANKVCRYKLDSYWTYQLCHGRSLRQYHEDTVASKVAIMEFYLGKSDAETRKRDNELYKKELEEKLKSDSSASPPTIKFEGIDYPYFIMNMSYGTLCDINQKPRSTQVYYICDEHSDHDIQSFEESSTCVYKVIVRTPLLCRHPKYRVEVASENEISCHREQQVPVEVVEVPDSEETSEKVVNDVEDEADVNQPLKLQEMERDNRNFRKSSVLDSDNGHYENDLKRNLKIFFLQDEEEARIEPPQHDEKDVQRVLTGDTCLTGGSSWWRYEFCYGRKVTQYHVEKGERTQEILLGKWDEAAHRKWVNANIFRKVPPNPLYVRHFYGNGDICAVTGKPRTVEVKLACKAIQGHPSAVSIFLVEKETCEYKLTVESQLVCSLLKNVDKDGLPELVSPANGHRAKKPEAENVEESKKEAAES